MRNLSFSGYAQRKGFDPNQVPDETWKIQDETERTLRGMREVRNQNQQNRSEVLDSLKENNRKEEQQRDLNFNLAQEFKKAYHDAEMQHYKTRILDQDVKIREAQANYERFEKLKDLAPKAIQAYGQFQNQRFENIIKKGAQLNRNFEELVGPENYQRFIDLSHQGFTVKEIMREKMPNFRQLTKDFNFFELRAIQHDIVDKHMFNTLRPGWIKYANTEKINGLTYNERKKDPNATPEELATYFTQYRNQYEDSFAFTRGEDGQLRRKFGDEFIANTVRKKLDEYEFELRAGINTHVEKNLQAEEAENEAKSYRLMATEGADYYFQEHLPKIQQKEGSLNTFFHHLQGGVEKNLSGKFTPELIADIKGIPLTVDGETTTVGQKFWKRFVPIDKALKARVDQDLENDKTHAINTFNRYRQKIFEIENAYQGKDGLPVDGFEVTPSLYKKFIEEMKTQDGISDYYFENTKEGRALLDGANRSTEEYNADKWRAWGNLKIAQNGKLTLQEISAVHNVQVKQELFSKTVEGFGLDPQSYNTMVKEALEKKIKAFTGVKKTDEILSTQLDEVIEQGMSNYFGEFFFDYMGKNVPVENGKPLVKPEEVARAAIREYVNTRMSKDSGFYEVYGVGADARFAMIDKLYEATAERRIQHMLPTDSSMIYDQDFLTESMDKQIIDAVKKGKTIPQVVYDMHKAVNGKLNHIEIINARLVARGQKPIEYVGAQLLHKHVHSNFRKQMNNLPSLGKTFNSLKNTADLEGNEDQVAPAILESLMMDKEIGGNYDVSRAVRTPNGIKEIDLGGITVEQIFSQMHSGQIQTVSGFSLDKEDLRRQLVKGNIDRNTLLSKDVLYKIAKEKLYADTTVLYATGVDEPIPGNGQANVLPFNYAQKQRKKRKTISKEQHAENIKTFNKLATDAVVAAQTLPDQALSLTGKFIVDKIKAIATAEGQPQDWQKRIEARRSQDITQDELVKETTDILISAELAKLGIKVDDLDPAIKERLYSKFK